MITFWKEITGIEGPQLLKLLEKKTEEIIKSCNNLVKKQSLLQGLREMVENVSRKWKQAVANG